MPSLADFFDGDREKMLLCPFRAVKNHLSRTEENCPACYSLFILMAKRKKLVSRNTISFSIRSVVAHVYKYPLMRAAEQLSQGECRS